MSYIVVGTDLVSPRQTLENRSLFSLSFIQPLKLATVLIVSSRWHSFLRVYDCDCWWMSRQQRRAVGCEGFFACGSVPRPQCRVCLWCLYLYSLFTFSWLSWLFFPFANYIWFMLWNGSRIEWFSFSKYQLKTEDGPPFVLRPPSLWRGHWSGGNKTNVEPTLPPRAKTW